MTMIQYENLTIRQAKASDAKQLTAWWNDGAVMAHAGFPKGLGTTEEKVIEGLTQESESAGSFHRRAKKSPSDVDRHRKKTYTCEERNLLKYRSFI